MRPHIHIVCLDNPWPADYGGAIDMYQKILALHNAGVAIHLHYFEYGSRTDRGDLATLCKTIHSYPRATGRKGFSFSLPYIVSSRINNELIARLNEDEHPVIFEGIHTTGNIPGIKNKRKILVRLHNDEHRYYKKLAAAEKSISKKIYFLYESRLLKKYQSLLPKDIEYASICPADTKIFSSEYGLPRVQYLPAFLPWKEVNGAEGVGNFCLYHGNLAIAENEKAAYWLLSKVFTRIKVPLVIAGKNPSARLDKVAHLCQHTCLVANPSEKEIDDLVKKAHIHVLPSLNVTGIKLKLLHALFEGRHCIVNEAAVKETGLEPACHIAANENAFASIVMQLYHQPFEEEEIRLRKELLGEYDNEKNARKIIAWLC